MSRAYSSDGTAGVSHVTAPLVLHKPLSLGKINSTINSVNKVNMSIHISQISERRDNDITSSTWIHEVFSALHIAHNSTEESGNINQPRESMSIISQRNMSIISQILTMRFKLRYLLDFNSRKSSRLHAPLTLQALMTTLEESQEI